MQECIHLTSYPWLSFTEHKCELTNQLITNTRVCRCKKYCDEYKTPDDVIKRLRNKRGDKD